jgi:hypothetical protein
MLTSKRQEWILQLIKGADIAVAEDSPGCYQPKSTVRLAARNGQWTIRPVDLLDLSNSECLVARISDGELMIRWDHITGMNFEEKPVEIHRAPDVPCRLSIHRLLHFPLEKKG